jgi:flagellar biosynthesis protein
MTRSPTGPVAVALTYEFGKSSLPRVVASGRGVIAGRILDIAMEAGIPVREDPDLATLLAAVDLDSEIPPEAMIAVAEILAQILLLNRQMQATTLPQRYGADHA